MVFKDTLVNMSLCCYELAVSTRLKYPKKEKERLPDLVFNHMKGQKRKFI